MAEQILVIPEDRIEVLGDATGYIPLDSATRAHLLDVNHMQFLERTDELEANPKFKQLIPYMILRYFHTDGHMYVFQYTRNKKQGEKRLHSKRSIGIGGHVNPSDIENDTHPLFGGAVRELAEEVEIFGGKSLEREALLYDPSNDVGKVHLGVVMHMALRLPAVIAKEDSMSWPGFVRIDQLVEAKDEFENWSQLCIDHLVKGTLRYA